MTFQASTGRRHFRRVMADDILGAYWQMTFQASTGRRHFRRVMANDILGEYWQTTMFIIVPLLVSETYQHLTNHDKFTNRPRFHFKREKIRFFYVTFKCLKKCQNLSKCCRKRWNSTTIPQPRPLLLFSMIFSRRVKIISNSETFPGFHDSRNIYIEEHSEVINQSNGQLSTSLFIKLTSTYAM